MANVGTVQSVTGIVRAIAEDGSERILSAGDSVAENEEIITGDGVVAIAFTDGEVMDLGSNSSLVLNDDVLNPEGEQTAQSEASANDEVAALQEALINNPNYDPTTALPATASGGAPGAGTGGNDGHTTVSVNYLNPEAPVEAGFDTVGINHEFQQPEEELPPVIVEDGTPSTGETSRSVDEDDLSGRQRSFISNEIFDEFNDATNLSLYPSFAQGNHDDAPGDDNQGASAPTVVSGALNASFGSDGAGDIVFNAGGQPALTSGGETVFYWVSDDGHTLIAYTSEGMLFGQSSGGEDSYYYATVIFVAEITDPVTGAYRFSLEGPLDHPDGSTEDNLIVDLAYTITDSDGDAAQGALSIDVDDDSPLVTLGKSSDSASEFTIVNHDEVSSAGYHNSYGYYVKTLDVNGDVISGNPTIGVVIEDDVHVKDGGFTVPVTVTGYSQEQIGYFIIPNGDGKNPTLADGDQVFFSYVGGQWQAFSDAGFTSPIVGAGSHVLFDVGSLNKDGQDHMVDNLLTGNQNWEDLQIPRGDGDYNDVNANVDWTKVTVTGEAVESVSFGADGEGSSSIDFTFDPLDVAATSNGDIITLTAKDTDGDGLNDQIVGMAGGNEVLTIDGVLDGQYDVNVLGPIDDGGADVNQDITVHVAATDGDGDVTLADLSININIDLNQVLAAPVA